MNRRTLHALGAALCATVLALSLVACGSSDPKGGSTPLSADDFRSQANGVCKTAFEDVSQIQADADVSTLPGAQAAVSAFTDRIDKLVADLKVLKAPADLQSGVTDLLDTVTAVVTVAKQQGAGFLAGTTNPFAEADQKAVALGLPACAGVPDPSPSATPTVSSAPLTADELKVRANAICKDANVEMDALVPPKSPTTQELDEVYQTLARLLLAEVDDLKVLTPPAELATKYAALLASVTTAANTVKDKGADTASLEANPFDDPYAKAIALGLTVCARR